MAMILFLVVIFFYGLYTKWGTRIPDTLKPPQTQKYSVVLTTYGSQDDQGHWQGEAAPYMERLVSGINVSSRYPMCIRAYKGYLFSQPVLIIISGQAKVRMAACMENILEKDGNGIKEVVLSGTAGITPARGGLVGSTGKLSRTDLVMIGDVCINSGAFDFDQQHYSSDIQNTKNPDPVFWNYTSENSAGFVDGSHPLANELYAASHKVVWPSVSSDVISANLKYHQVSRSPKSWGPTQCLESTDDLFWHDSRSDLRARIIGAGWLNSTQGLNLTSDDILIATSMEAVPAGAVINWWNQTNKTQIAFAYVRGASNFDQPWVNNQGVPQENGKTSLESGTSAAFSQLASFTASLPVLKMLELRNYD